MGLSITLRGIILVVVAIVMGIVIGACAPTDTEISRNRLITVVEIYSGELVTRDYYSLEIEAKIKDTTTGTCYYVGGRGRRGFTIPTSCYPQQPRNVEETD
jgi:hypothetical protein